MDKKLSELIKSEASFSQNNYFGNPDADIFSYTEYQTYVCLSAPHATRTTTSKHIKGCDLYTGGIVKYIGEKNHISYIVRNKYFHQKCMISSFIFDNHLENHYFLDIHAMKNRPFDLAVGIGYCTPDDYKQELSIIRELCKKYHLKYVINHPSYTGQPGLTGRLQKKLSQANIMQLEWTIKYRDFNKHAAEVLSVTLPFIEELTNALNSIQKPKLAHSITARYNLFQKLKNHADWLKRRLFQN